MSVTLFGGEKKRVEEASQSYANKYPLSNDISSLQKSVNLAQVDLADLKAQQPTTSGGKRIRQRNITALSNRIMQLQNKIKDLSGGLSTQFGGLAISSPSVATLPSSVTTTNSLNTFTFGSTQFNFKEPQRDPITGLYKGLVVNQPEGQFSNTNETQKSNVKNVLPPKIGEQSTNSSTYLMYGGLALGVGVLAYYMFKK